MPTSSWMMPLPIYLTCKVCKQIKPAIPENFYKTTGKSQTGWMGTCKQCLQESGWIDRHHEAEHHRRKLRKAKLTPEQLERRREQHRQAANKHKYIERHGVTVSQRDAMLATQDNKCALCHTAAPRLVIDKRSTMLRGMVCYVCLRRIKKIPMKNIPILRQTTTDPDILKLLDYLERPLD